MALSDITLEAVASGIVGLLLLGGLIKRAWDGYAEARKAMRAQANSPMVQAMASVWDEKERERFMQLMERLVKSQENQAESLAELTNRQAQEMRDQIQFLVEKLGEKESQHNRRRPPQKNRNQR